jgi:hypothetical protein
MMGTSTACEVCFVGETETDEKSVTVGLRSRDSVKQLWRRLRTVWAAAGTGLAGRASHKWPSVTKKRRSQIRLVEAFSEFFSR